MGGEAAWENADSMEEQDRGQYFEKWKKSFLVDQKYSVRKTGAQIDALTFISFKHAQQMNLWRHFTGAQSALTNGKSEREIREYEGWKEWTSSGAPTRIDI